MAILSLNKFLDIVKKIIKLFVPPIFIKPIKFVLHPKRGFAKIIIMLDNSLLFYRKIPDALQVKNMFLLVTGESLNLKKPQNFNQKIQWIKLYDRNPLYTKLADKYEVREYVKMRIGDEYLIPLLGVYNKFNDINFEELPKEFVIKCNHDCGSVIICKNKSQFDIDSVKEKIERCLSINPFYKYPYREWQYKDIKPKIIVEKYLTHSSGEDINDYKFFCFNGEPKCFYISADLSTPNQKVSFFDLEWNDLYISAGFENIKSIPEKPKMWKEMLLCARKLSQDIPFVRVDLYEVDDKIYFSELTFTPHGGYYPFKPSKWNKIFGDWLNLKLLD